MFDTFRNAWKIPELRKKILYTLMVIVIFRLGCVITVPYINADALTLFASGTGNMLDYLNMMSGGALSQCAIFALGVGPYINASIIMQLLTVAIPALERLSKEGEDGRRKLTRITRYVGGGIALAMAIGYYLIIRNNYGAVAYTTGWQGWFAAVVIVLTFTAGAQFITWLGEQIDAKGIGNGVSLLIFAGIISRWSSVITAVKSLLTRAASGEPQIYAFLPLFLVLALVVVVGSFINFDAAAHPFWASFFQVFNYRSFLYAVIYLLLIVAFNYFYVAIQYNPVEIANNLRKNNGAIPGIRPGKPTSDFITKSLSKITFIGAMFLGVVAILPIILGNVTGTNIQLGGTSLLIVVGVALDTGRSMESYMLMRHHKGFLE